MKRLQDMTEVELSEYLTISANTLLKVAEICQVEKPLFVLLLFNDPKLGQYISNVQRQDVVKALRQAADRLDNREDLVRNEPSNG